MRKINPLVLIFLCGFLPLIGQDRLPMVAKNENPLNATLHLRSMHLLADTIGINTGVLPSFIIDSTNIIRDENKMLDPILDQFRKIKEKTSKEVIRIVHIGDSHIRGKIFPNWVRDRLQEEFEGYVEYESFGINGATCFTFTNPRWIKKVKQLNPDFLILSFGTNESHNKRYQKVVHLQQLDELIQLLKKENPSLPLLFTTPPGSYTNYRGRNRRRVYNRNTKTIEVVNAIKEYAQNNGYPIWDLFSAVGGENGACKNWMSAKLMRPDHVHFVQNGYELQGELLYQALMKQYNQYVIR